MIKRASILLLLILSSISFVACNRGSNIPVEKQEFHMDTIITEKVYGENAQKAANEVMDKITQIEKVMTIDAPGSEIDKLNDMAGKGGVKLGKESIYVLQKANKYAALSGGAFDVSIGPLVKAWGITTNHHRVLTQEEVSRLKKLVGYKDIEIDNKASTAKLKRSGQIVDLGGIAKGFAGDAAIAICKKNGIKSAFINLGGNVVVLGSKSDGSAWNIGVQNPRAITGQYIGILKVKNKAIVSSGDYERFFIENGKRYHHIIDPKTGFPADSGLIGTTIITDLSVDADALSTATFVLGLEKGMKLVESLPEVEAIFVTKDKKVYTSKGLKDIFTFDDESKEFEYVKKR
jgi:FAD:protein FMN transferase